MNSLVDLHKLVAAAMTCRGSERMGWGFAYLIGMIAALCIGGPLAFAQSPEPIDPPDPKRLVVTARSVVKSELIVYDPVVVRLGSTRQLPEVVVLPRHRRVAIKAGLKSLYLALPVRMRTVVSARMDSIGIAVPEPNGISIALLISAAELEMPVLRNVGAVIMRHRPEIALITEPLAMSAVIQRGVAPVFVRHRE